MPVTPRDFQLPNAQTINESEALVNGVDASCGPTASYIAAGIVNDFDLNQQGLQQLVADAQDAGTLNTGGQLFSTGPQWDLSQYNIASTVSSPTSATQLQSTLDAALSQNKPAVLGLSNANQLTGEPAGLYGHFVTAVGTNADGTYIISDPNLGQFTDNSLGQLFAAQPVSVTVPSRSATGVPTNATAALEGGGLFPSLIQVQLPDMTGDIEQVVSDVFPFTRAENWLNNVISRFAWGAIGGLIFLISFDYFLGTFAPVNTPRTGPLLSGIKKLGQKSEEASKALEEKGKEIAQVAGEAAVVA